MRALTESARRMAYIAIVVAVAVGVSGYVRISAIMISLATGAIALDNRSGRRIEMYLPLAIAVALFAVAIALPRGL